MPSLAVGHGAVSYEDRGAGELVLLVHGSPGTARAWSRVGELLSARYRVVAPDLPGHGDTPPPADAAASDIGHAASVVEAIVAELGVPAVLAGHSYGGVVALAVALRRRVAPRALVLLEPVAVPVLAAIGETGSYERARAALSAYISSFEGGDGDAIGRMIDFWFGPGAFDRMPGSLRGYLRRETPTNIREVRATLSERYSLDELRGLPIPLLVVYGENSPDVTRKIARALAEHAAQGTCRSVAGADHGLTTTHAEAVARIVDELAAGGGHGPARAAGAP